MTVKFECEIRWVCAGKRCSASNILYVIYVYLLWVFFVVVVSQCVLMSVCPTEHAYVSTYTFKLPQGVLVGRNV